MALNTYILSLLTEKWLGARNLYRWHEYQFNYGRINSSTISIHVTRETFKHNTLLVRLTNLESFVWLSSRNNLKFFHHYDGFFLFVDQFIEWSWTVLDRRINLGAYKNVRQEIHLNWSLPGETVCLKLWIDWSFSVVASHNDKMFGLQDMPILWESIEEVTSTFFYLVINLTFQ